MSPAWPSSSSLRNISTPVTVVLLRVAEADDLDLFVDLDDAALDAARGHRAAALDREHVLDRHQERLVDVAHRLRDLAVERVEQLADRLLPLRVAVAAPGSAATADDLRVVAVELVLVEELADFHLDEVEHLRVFDRVALVQRTTTMWWRPTWRASSTCSRVCGMTQSSARHDQDRAVHLRRARDHVLDVVGVAGAIDVRVVALRRSRTPRATTAIVTVFVSSRTVPPFAMSAYLISFARFFFD